MVEKTQSCVSPVIFVLFSLIFRSPSAFWPLFFWFSTYLIFFFGLVFDMFFVPDTLNVFLCFLLPRYKVESFGFSVSQSSTT